MVPISGPASVIELFYRVGRSIVDETGFLSMCRPSCLIEAYGRPEKYWLVWAGLKANDLFNFNFIFLSNGLTAAVERVAGPADFYRH
jgi:hypothetical protein